LLVGLYRTVGTTHLGGACRFSPSCSEYAIEALNIHNPFKAIFLIIKRILRCRPGVPGGFDPVPIKARIKEEKNNEHEQ
jgi:putative membrane protein insertion efficiency factor